MYNTKQYTAAFYYHQSSTPIQNLLHYCENYTFTINKYEIERTLADQIINALFDTTQQFQLPQHLQLPTALYSRSSGKVLSWVIRQSAKLLPQDEPSISIDIPFAIIEKEATYLAIAYALWPQNPLLVSFDVQRTLFTWLSKYHSTLGWLALALARVGNLALAEQSLQMWLRGPIATQHFDYLIQAFLEVSYNHDSLRSSVQLVISRVAFTYTGQNADTLLTTLARLAFRYEYYVQTAEIASMILLNSASQELSQEMEAMHIASCAAIGYQDLPTTTLSPQEWRQTALNNYVNSWLGYKTAFPHPQFLLLIFDDLQTLKYRRMLLLEQPLDRSTDMPMFSLTQEDMVAWLSLETKNEQGIWRETIEGWQKLLQKSGDIYFLIRLTIAIYFGQVYIKENPIIKDTLRVWRHLLDEKQIPKSRADAAFFILREIHQESDFQTYYEEKLAKIPIDTDILLVYAAEAFIRKLFQYSEVGWQEPVKRFFQRKDVAPLRHLWLEEEYLFYQIFADLFDYQEKERWIEWLRCWERLLSIHLDISQVIQAVEYFVDTQSNCPSTVSDNDLHDMKLQIELWGRQEGERLLSYVDPKEQVVFQSQLRKSSIDSLAIILRGIQIKL